MNLYLILHAFFQMIFLSVFSFHLQNLEEFRVWMAEKGTNFYKKKFWSFGAGVQPPTPRRGLGPLRPRTCSLPPYVYTSSFLLYTRPSQIGGGGFSSLCVHSLCRTLRTESHKITYATWAYFSTPLLHNILL